MKPDISTSVGQKAATKKGVIAVLLLAACFIPMAFSQYPEERLTAFAAMSLFGCFAIPLLWILAEMSRRQKWIDAGSVGDAPTSSRLGKALGTAAVFAGWQAAGALMYLSGYLYPHWHMRSFRSNPQSAMVIGSGLSVAAMILLSWSLITTMRDRRKPT